jgi:hypothetical protein
VTIKKPELEDIFELMQVLRQSGLADTKSSGGLNKRAVCPNGIHRPEQREL